MINRYRLARIRIRTPFERWFDARVAAEAARMEDELIYGGNRTDRSAIRGILNEAA